MGKEADCCLPSELPVRNRLQINHFLRYGVETIDTQTRTGRIRGWLRQCRRGLLGLAVGVWAVGCIYGIFTRPVPDGALCTFYPDAGAATRRLVILDPRD